VAGSAAVAAALPKLTSASEGAVGPSVPRSLGHGPLSGRGGSQSREISLGGGMLGQCVSVV